MLGALCCLLALIYFFGPHRQVSIFLLFFLLTAGFQMIPLKLMILPSAGINKPYDWALLLEGAILLLRPQVFLNASVWKNFKVLILYGAFLVLLLLYSIFIKDVETSVSIRVFRGLIYFTTIFLFVQLTQEELAKTFRIIIIFTSVAAMLYCLQPFVHKTLLNKVYVDNMGMSDSSERYYNLPVYIYPVIFLLLISKNCLENRYRYLFLFINCAAIFLSQHRNLLLAVLVCSFLHFLLAYRFSVVRTALFTAASIGVFSIADSLWNNRFSRGLEEISQTSLAVSPAAFYEVNLGELSTVEFRKMLLQERLHYIVTNKSSTLLGIGLITDDSRKAASLNFNIGMSDGYGNITQVASGDIAWSPMLLQVGLAGTIFFIFYHLALLKNFFTYRMDSYMQAGVLYIICLFITSFFSNTIVLPFTAALLMLFGAYYSTIDSAITTTKKHGPH